MKRDFHGSSTNTNGPTLTWTRETEHTTYKLKTQALESLAQCGAWDDQAWNTRVLRRTAKPWLTLGGTNETQAISDARAWRHLAADETALELERLQYRLRLLHSTTGRVYRATVAHMFTPEGGTNAVAVSVTNRFAVGTGGEVEFRGGPTVIEPPEENGSVRVAGLLIDIDGDFNRDGSIDSSDPDDPDENANPGLIAGVNLDDDNSNNIIDKSEDGGSSGISGENDLIKIHIAALPSAVSAGDVILCAPTTGNGSIKIWASPTKGSDNLILDSASLTEWKKTWSLNSAFTSDNIPRDLYVEATRGSTAYGDISLVLRYENPSGAFIGADVIKITAASAFVGRRMFGYGDEHVGNISSSVQNILIYETTTNQSVTKADAINIIPAKQIWYTFSHGMVDANGVFKAVDFGDPLLPSDVPSGANYLLVFLNGCCSAQPGGESNADAFKSAFGATTYIGWKGEMEGALAAGFAEELFSQLDGNKNINQAIADALGTYKPGTYAYGKIAENIRVIGDENLVVDLSK